MDKVNKKWEIVIELPKKVKMHPDFESLQPEVFKHFMEWAKLIEMQQNVNTGNLWTTIGHQRFLNLKLVPQENPVDTTVNYVCDHWEDVL